MCSCAQTTRKMATLTGSGSLCIEVCQFEQSCTASPVEHCGAQSITPVEPQHSKACCS